MIPRVYVMSDRRKPWHTSYFVACGSRIIARGLTHPQALRLALHIAV